MSLSKEKFIAMIEMQDQINKYIDQNWQIRDWDFYRAMTLELGEAIDHHGWKWWKKQDCNMPQVQMELIDVWHFALSAFYKKYDCNLEKWGELVEEASKREDHGEIHIGDSSRNLDDVDLLTCLELLMAGTAAKGFSITLFNVCLLKAGLTWQEVFKQYIAKNTLNKFRQDHGYKDGTYIKIWHGEEDNEHLCKIIDDLDENSPTFSDDIYSRLMVIYDSLTH